MRDYVLKAGKLLFILVMTGALYAYAMFQGGYVSWFLFYGVLVVVLVNVIFTLYPLRKIEVERTCNKTLLSYNETAEVTVTIEKKVPFPFFFISVHDQVPNGLKGFSDPPGTVFFLAASKELSYTYTIHGQRRGEYHFSSVELKAGDLFGFFQKEQQVPLTETVTVLPNIYSLKEWNLELVDHEHHVSIPNKADEDMSAIAGVRDYIPGDKMTSIDWKVSARTGKLVTKEFETESGQGYMIVLGTTCPEDALEKFERLIEYTASLSAHCYERSIPIGFTVLERETPLIYEGTGRSHFRQIYQELARVERKTPHAAESALLNKPVTSPFIVCITLELTSYMMENLQFWLSRRKNVAIHYGIAETLSREEQEKLDYLKGQGAFVHLIPVDSSTYKTTV